MKQISWLIAMIVGTGLCHPLYSQGWVAKVDLNFTHDLYAYENIANATLTYSGVTVTGSSETGHLQLVINGTGSISGGGSAGVSITSGTPQEFTTRNIGVELRVTPTVAPSSACPASTRPTRVVGSIVPARGP